MRHAPLVSLAICLSAASPALAQDAAPPVIVKAGLVASDFYAVGFGAGVDTGSFDVDGFGAGVATRVPLGGRFALQLEALWLRKAADVVVSVNPFPGFGFTDLGVRVRTDYLELPAMLRYELSAGDTRPYFLFGPAVAVKLSSDASGDLFETFIDRGYISPAFEDNVRAVDALLGVGAGADFAVSAAGGWSVEVRASWGLRGVFGSFDDAPRPTRSRAKNRSYMVLAGYRF